MIVLTSGEKKRYCNTQGRDIVHHSMFRRKILGVLLLGHIALHVMGFSPTLSPSKAGCPSLSLHSHAQETHESIDNTGRNRRSVLASIAGALSLAVAWGESSVANGDDSPPITHKVYMDLRVSRSDGTFYVRDDLPDTPENAVFYTRLVFGLFGTVAPQHVEQFLKYVNVDYSPLDDNPLPSYGRSSFKSLDQATGMCVSFFGVVVVISSTRNALELLQSQEKVTLSVSTSYFFSLLQDC